MSQSAPPVRRNSLEKFIPTHGDLIIRDNLSDGTNISMEDHRKSGHLRRPATMGGYRFGKLSMSSFFTRHNPHPRRVNHFKGLLDVPICTVNDYDSAKRDYNLDFPPNGYAKDMLRLPTECINVNSSQYPMDTLTGLHYFHPLQKLPFGQKPSSTPATAAAVTEPWRVELQELAKAAGIPEKAAETPKLERQRTSQYSAATGRIIPPPTKSLSRGNSRAATAQFLSQTNTARDILGQPDNVEDTVMMMLCQILQTEDVQAVQNWLGSAGEHERGMVQELIKAAMSGKGEDYRTQYPVQEYMIGLDGLPMTPDIGTVIGDHVQNRLSTAADDDQPPLPEPSMRPISAAGPAVEEVIARIEQFSPRIKVRPSLPPIAEAESMANNAPVLESFIKPEPEKPLPVPSPIQSKSAKPLPAISRQQGFNKALENITRQTLEGLYSYPKVEKYTTYAYPMKEGEEKTTLQIKPSSSSAPKLADVQPSPGTPLMSTYAPMDSKMADMPMISKESVWKPAEATV